MSRDIFLLQAVEQMSRHVDGHVVVVQTPHLEDGSCSWGYLKDHMEY